jgi:protocatechuate 3,4-dioxygenase beta subunit
MGQLFNSQVDLELVEGGSAHVSLGGAPANAVRVFGVVRANGPLSGVTVSLSRHDSDNRYGNSRDAVTDADGRYELSVDSPGEYSANFRSGKGGNAWMQCTIPEGTSFELNATLPVGSLSGRVVDDEGKPLAGIHVTAQSQTRHANGPGELQTGWGQTESGSDGAFEINMLAPGTYGLTAQAQTWGRSSTKSKSSGTAQLEGVELAEGGAVTGLVLRLPRAGSVHGVVTGPDGPVAGAQVTLSTKDRAPFGHQDMTDESGRYEINGINPGTVTLVAFSESAASKRSEAIEVHADESAEVDLHLEPGGKIHTLVKDASGKAVEKPWKVLDEHGRDCRDYPMYWANSGGQEKGWTIGPIPAGSYTVRIVTDHAGEESETRIDKHVDLAAGATENVVVQLP